MRRLIAGLAAIGALASPAAAPALAAAPVSQARLWSALGGQVTCGVAIIGPRIPAPLLCSARAVPPPAQGGSGDPGFVLLSTAGRARPVRLSQDSFAARHAATLAAGASWSGVIAGVRCAVGARQVRCANRSGHGFTLTRTHYRSF